MDTVVAANNLQLSPAVILTATIMHFPSAQDDRIPVLEISISDFHFDFSSPVSRITFADTFNGYVVEAPIYEDVIVVIHLIGRLVESVEQDGLLEQDKFLVEEVFMRVESQSENPQSDFVTSTLLAIISLAEDVRLHIPEVELDLSLKIHSSLSEVSLMLQRRQLSYRFMVVERATGYKFKLPAAISGTEVENLAFIYQAIVERSFVFPFTIMTYPSVPATKDYLEQITDLSRKSFIVVGPEPLSKTLLGKQIPLGDESSWIIENAAIENFDQVQKELASGDGRGVEVVIRSLNGRARYNLPTAPLLPHNPWSAQLQKLINLDADLDARLVKRFHALAAATLANLSIEEKVAIATRPELDVNIFLSE